MKKHPDTRRPMCFAVLGATLMVMLTSTTSVSSAQTLPRVTHPLMVPSHPVRFGDRTLESTIRTDERYGHDDLFQGPRGWVYWNYLDNPHPIQNPNLWPDMRSTYFMGRFAMPAGSSLTLRGTFPYARFFQFALYKFERNTFVGETTKPMTPDQWIQLVKARDNDPKMTPQITPARSPPQWEKFWTIAYSVVGVFKSPAERAKFRYEGEMEGGGEGPYLVTYLSRQYGPVYVMRGKMPTFPDTYAGKDGRGAATMKAAQTQYWSLVSCESVPSGQVVDGLSDFQIPLDENRNYTIVVSRPEDRPKNATREHGVAWIKWSPRGEGLDDPRNRADFGMLILRIMGNNPSWKERPDNIKKPGTGEAVMGSYFPKGYYTTKEEFESRGAKQP